MLILFKFFLILASAISAKKNTGLRDLRRLFNSIELRVTAGIAFNIWYLLHKYN